MKAVYVAVLALLILTGVFLADFFSFQEPTSSILHDQATPFESLLPQDPDSLVKVTAEASPLFAQQVPSGNVRPVPVLAPPPVFEPIPEPDLLTVPAPFPAAPVPQPSLPDAVPAPGSYIYFFTGVPVQSVPMPSAVVYTNTYPHGFTPATPAMPVFVPQVVPSRVGVPKWVYPNGVVIKPKVYYPHQPVRNTLRGVTP